ncbi:MAG: guanylate kinase, partial [Thermodesulfobacteriota bacterium]|nr:guanylate kinase [Thermodesulfobacteriota bacterium]
MNDKKDRRFGLKPGSVINERRGRLFIISAPSGSGKTTLCSAVLNRFQDMVYSVSYTTRKPRNGEQSGIDYHFITKKDFKDKIKDGKWAEWAEVHGNYYGTSTELLDKGLNSGRDIILDIDVQGTILLLERYPESVTIFVMPPSIEELKRRLKLRNTDSSEVIARRLENAKIEMAKKDLYIHVIINDQLPDAIEQLVA